MIEGAFVLLVGIVIGAAGDRLLGFWFWRRGEQRALNARPVCSCTHAASFHDGKGCHDKVRLKDPLGYWHWHECTCKRYDGPQPLPAFYAPDIAP